MATDELKAIKRGDDRYALWSHRVSDCLLEGVSRAELIEWYLQKRPDGTRGEIEALVDAADDRAPDDVGPTSYEDSADWLAGN